MHNFYTVNKTTSILAVSTLLFFILSLCLPLVAFGQTTETIKVVNGGSQVATLSVPRAGIQPSEIAVLINDHDPQSVEVANYYQQKRGIPSQNMIHLNFDETKIYSPFTKNNGIDDTVFAGLKSQVEAATGPNIQAYAISWTNPFRLASFNYYTRNYSITSAFGFGVSPAHLEIDFCNAMPVSNYYDSNSTRPYTDLGVRPAMLLAGTNAANAKAMIDKGVLSDGSFPTGPGWFVRTSDTARSNPRYSDFQSTVQSWNRPEALSMNYYDYYANGGNNMVQNKSNMLFYETGIAWPTGITTNTYAPGAIADHLTSYGGDIFGTDQMSILRWLEAGATGSFGTIIEPCNYLTEKFPRASVLVKNYFRGNTLVEAYQKSVKQPAMGLLVGDPLARPFGTKATLVNGTLTITTTSLEPGTNYAVYSAPSATGPFTQIATVSVPNYQIKTITVPGMTAPFYKLENTSTPADTTAPSAPTGLTANAISTSQINLTWSASTDNVGVVGYRVFRGTTQVGSPTGTSYSDTGLSASTAYSYTVKAIDSAGNLSNASNAASATTQTGSTADTTAPSTPTNLNGTAASQSQINLTWSASTDNVGVTGYKVYRNGAQVGTPSGTSYSDTGLSASTAYSYTVAAYDAAGNTSAQSTARSVTTMGAPASAPTVSLSASPASVTAGNNATLSWSSTNATSCTGTGFTASGTSGSVTVTPSVTTTYSITCTGSGGSGSASAIVTVSNPAPAPTPTGDTTAPSAPTSLNGTAASASQINLSWIGSTDNVGVTGYKVFRNGVHTGSVSGTIFSDTALTASTAYSYTVAAHDRAGNTSAQSAAKSVTTLGSSTPTPTPSPFAVGVRVQTTANLKVRSAPTNSTNNVLCTQANGALGTIIGGPTLANGYKWWQINFDTKCDGWSVQDYLVVSNTTPPTPTPAATASLSASPSSVTSGGSSTLSWSSTNATSCTGSGFSASGTSGSVTVTPSVTTTYSITCTGSGGSGSASATVTVSATPAPPPAATATLSASPASITSGNSATLSWSSTNATSCTGSGFSASGTSGSVTVTPSVTTTYSITCTGSGGSGSASATVTVSATPAPNPSGTTANLTASRTSITTPGQTVNLTWSSSNALECVGTGFNTGYAISGSTAVSPDATITYSVTCSGAGSSSASASATVTVGSSAPTAPAADTSAPTTPTGLSGSAVSATQINLTWTASTDSVGVTGYKVYRNGTQVGTPTGTSYSDSGLTAGTAYSYTVAAYDAAGNTSAQSSAVNVSTQSSVSSAGLVAHWTFDASSLAWGGATSGTASDSTSNHNNAALTNVSQSTAPTTGRIGQALAFNGSTSFASAATSPSLSITGSAITLSTWVKINGAATSITNPNIQAFITRYGGEAYGLYYNYPYKNIIFAINSDSTYVNFPIDDGQWHLVTGVYNGSTMSIYVDGVLKGTPMSKTGNIVDDGKPVTLGSDAFSGNSTLNGALDDARIYSRALSASEVQALFQSTIAASGQSNTSSQLASTAVVADQLSALVAQLQNALKSLLGF